MIMKVIQVVLNSHCIILDKIAFVNRDDEIYCSSFINLPKINQSNIKPVLNMPVNDISLTTIFKTTNGGSP